MFPYKGTYGYYWANDYEWLNLGFMGGDYCSNYNRILCIAWEAEEM